MEGKNCTKCGEWKVLTDYHRNKRTADGRVYACKACKRLADQMRWEASDTAKRRAVIEAAAAWKQRNREAVREAGRRAYWNDVEKSRNRGREKHHAHRGELNAAKRKYRQTNREATRLYGRLRARRIIDALDDVYIANALFNLPVSALPPELIEAKRIQLQIKRYLKNGN